MRRHASATSAGVWCGQPIRRSTPSFHGSPRGTSGHAFRPSAAGLTADQMSMNGWPTTSTSGWPATAAAIRLSLDPATRWSTRTPSRCRGPGWNSSTMAGQVVDALQVLDHDADVAQVVAPDLLHQLGVVLALDVDPAGLGDLGPLLRRRDRPGRGAVGGESGFCRRRGRPRPDQGHPLAVEQERAGNREHPALPVPVLERHRVLLQRHHRAAESRLEVLHDQPGLGFDLVNRPLSGLGLSVLRREHVTPVLSALHRSYPNPDGPPQPGDSPGRAGPTLDRRTEA